MRWLSLCKYLLDAAMSWWAEWGKVIEAEKAAKAAGPIIDVPFQDVTNKATPPTP